MNLSPDSMGSTADTSSIVTEPTYVRASSLSDAASRLHDAGGRALGGGTDLIPSIHEHVVTSHTLIDLTGIDDLHGITCRDDGSASIGATTTLATIAEDAAVRERFPALADACSLVGSPALRNMGTIGGNLCQRPRCWYFRQGLPCHKHGGTFCYAYEGENEYHAILGGGPCYIVHPSDLAVALMALDAAFHLTAGDVDRRVPADDFFRLPTQRLDGENVLAPGEIIRAIELPAHAAGAQQCFEKVMQRGAWDFAVVSLAGARMTDGSVRLVLGGVAPIPWRVRSSVEEDVASGSLSPDDIDTLAERALYDAQPLAKNGYKIDIALALLRRAIAQLNGSRA